MEEEDILLQSFPENYTFHGNVSDGLLKEVLRNNVEHLLPLTSEENFKEAYKEFHGQNILAIACTRSEVSEETLKQLLEHVFDKYPQIDLTDENWYYWEPIHYAAYSVNHGKLKVILKSRYRDRINVLSVFSENALHVLLEYCRKSESFNVDFSNGWEKKTYQIISSEKDSLVECAKLLIDAGININHKNIWNEAPIIIALRYRFLRVLDILQNKKDIDIDYCRDIYLNKSARDIMKDYGIETKSIPLNTVFFDKPKLVLFTLLKIKDEDTFVRFSNEDIKRYSNALDADALDITSGNMLQLCLVKGFLEYQKEKTSADVNKNINKTRMLGMFCEKGMAKCVEHLLDNGAVIKRSNRMFHCLNAFQLSVKLSYYPYLVMLIEHRSNQIQSRDILDVLRDIEKPPFDPDNYYSRHVLFILLSKLEFFHNSCSRYIDYNHINIMNNILKYCLKNNESNMYDENIFQALRLGAQLSSKHSESVLHSLTFETLNTHFDHCIDDENNVSYNSIIVDNQHEYSEIQTLRTLYHHEKNSDLLNHPVLINFIHAKWQESKLFFYLNIGFHSLFLITLYLYMVLLQVNDLWNPVFYIFCSFITMLSLKELSEMYIYGFRYFFDLMNYIDMIVLACCTFNIFYKDERAMVVSILLYSFKTLLMLGQIPKFTKYMIIFSSTKYFFQYVLFYFIQFFAFALCFFILLPSENQSEFNPFEQILIKLFESMFFFIGQYDGEIASPTRFPAFARIVVIMFLFCMTIILNNLLVGLIVTDMDILQKRGKLLRQIKMAKYVVRVENFTNKFKFTLRWFYPNTRIFYIGEQKHLRLCFDILDDEDRDYLKEIHAGRKPYTQTPSYLYSHILGQTKNLDKQKNETTDILEKLAKLEEYLKKLKT